MWINTDSHKKQDCLLDCSQFEDRKKTFALMRRKKNPDGTASDSIKKILTTCRAR
jgi:hypothetical protein